MPFIELPRRRVLQLESFAATSSARGDATRFCVRNLPNARSVQVRRDDEICKSWRAIDSSTIEIDRCRRPLLQDRDGLPRTAAGRAPESRIERGESCVERRRDRQTPNHHGGHRDCRLDRLRQVSLLRGCRLITSDRRYQIE